MKKEKKYYGIKFNDEIPKVDKVNKFRKEVEIKFEGKANLIKRDDDDKIVERTEIENGYKLKKEKDYEIEFINCQNEIYYLQVRIECSYLLFILLLFWLGFIIGLILTRPIKQENSLLDRFYDFINISVLQLDIDKNSEDEKVKENISFIDSVIKRTRVIEEDKIQNQYNFDATFKNISSDDISLSNTIDAKAIAKNKVAPRC